MLVAREVCNSQVLIMTQSFPPVAEFTVIRMMLAIAANKGYKVHQLDSKTAFLYGDLDVDVQLQVSKEFHGM
jgi:Reverse transcriptase (RNA-dependent DNA polymerase)